MNAKILNLFLMIFVLMVISGCSTKDIVYVDRPVDKVVTNSCIIPEPDECKPNKPTYTEEVNQMRICVREYKRLVEICEKDNK